MNLLFVTHYGELYGANKSLLDQCEGLIRAGINVFVLAPLGNDFEQLAMQKGIELIGFNNFSKYTVTTILKPTIKTKIKEILKKVLCRISVGRNSKKIAKIIKKNDIDIVHTNCSVILEGAVAAKKAKVPHVLHIRECLEPAYNSKYSCPRFAKKMLYDSSKSIITISNTVKNYISPMVDNKSKIKVIYDAVELETDKDLLTSLNEKKVFVSTGVISRQKGFHDAIDAFAKMSIDAQEQAELWIVGGYDENDSYYQELLQKTDQYKLTEKVKFLGFRNDIGNIIKNAYCGLTCSYMEGLGRTTIEYMLSGKPVIGSNSGATVEILHNNETGLIYEYGNTDELAIKMEYLIKNSCIAQKFGQAGREYAEYEFSKERYTNLLLKVYEELLEKKDK